MMGDKITVGKINTKKTATVPKKQADIALRPYFAETDKKYVQYLFYSTYYNLVPKALFVRLKNPFILAAWVGASAYLVVVIPTLITNLGWPRELIYGIQVLISLVLIIGGVLSILWFADRYDITYRVIEGIENDMKEPNVYYRGTPDNIKKGNFWVLTLNDEIVGCIGMDQTLSPVMDQSYKHVGYVRASERPRAVDAPEIATAEWKRTAMIMAKADDMIRLVLVGVFDVARDAYFKFKGLSQNQVEAEKAQKQKVLFEAHKPNEASVRRLAIKLECQKHGLSTVLLKRVAFWAHAHQIEYLYADTDELQSSLNDILVKRHGYTFVSKKKLGYFKTKSTFRLDVKLWMQKELERRAEEQREEEQAKEDAELKQYE